MAFFHKSTKDGGNVGPSIHLLHGQSFRGAFSHGLTLIGISIRPPGEEDTFFECDLLLYWLRLWLYVRSPACYRRCKENGDFRLGIIDVSFDLQEKHKENIRLYQETDGFGSDYIGRKKFLEEQGKFIMYTEV